jgi:hypothetical protein
MKIYNTIDFIIFFPKKEVQLQIQIQLLVLKTISWKTMGGGGEL